MSYFSLIVFLLGLSSVQAAGRPDPYRPDPYRPDPYRPDPRPDFVPLARLPEYNRRIAQVQPQPLPDGVADAAAVPASI